MPFRGETVTGCFVLSSQPISRDWATVSLGLHTCQTLAVLLIHTNCTSLSPSNVVFGVMTLVLVLAQMSRKPWLGELSETALLCCDGSSVCHWGCQGNQGWGWKGSMNSFIVKHTRGLPLAFEGQRHAWCPNLFLKPEKRIGTSMQEAHTNFCSSPSWREPREDEITRHLPWNCLYLPFFLCQARSPSLCPPSILPLESLSSSLSSLVLVFPLSI